MITIVLVVCDEYCESLSLRCPSVVAAFGGLDCIGDFCWLAVDYVS